MSQSAPWVLWPPAPTSVFVAMSILPPITALSDCGSDPEDFKMKIWNPQPANIFQMVDKSLAFTCCIQPPARRSLQLHRLLLNQKAKQRPRRRPLRWKRKQRPRRKLVQSPRRKLVQSPRRHSKQSRKQSRKQRRKKMEKKFKKQKSKRLPRLRDQRWSAQQLLLHLLQLKAIVLNFNFAVKKQYSRVGFFEGPALKVWFFIGGGKKGKASNTENKEGAKLSNIYSYKKQNRFCFKMDGREVCATKLNNRHAEDAVSCGFLSSLEIRSFIHPDIWFSRLSPHFRLAVCALIRRSFVKLSHMAQSDSMWFSKMK